MQGLKSRPDCLWQQGHIDVGDIFYLEDYYTVVLYMSIIATFVLLIVIRSLERHKKRDLGWMESLI